MGYLTVIGRRSRGIDSDIENLTPVYSVSDKVPILDMEIDDANSQYPVATGQEILLIDAATFQPTHNLLLNSTLLSPLGSTTLTQPPPNNQSPLNAWTLVEPSGTSITTGTNGNGHIVTLSSTSLNSPSLGQYTQTGLVADTMSYCASVYLDPTNLASGTYAALYLDFYSSLAPTVFPGGGGGSSAHLGGTFQQFSQSNGERRVSVTGVAPAGTTYVAVTLALLTASTATTSCTFRAVQLEPVWFSDIQAYPTSDCNVYDTRSYTLPNNTVIRQNRVFAGMTTQTDIVEYVGTDRVWKVSAKGPSYLLDSQFVNGTYDAQYDSAIIISTVSASLTGYVTTHGVLTGAYIDERVYDDSTLEEMLNDFANTSNFTYYIDFYYDLKYAPVGTTMASGRLSSIESEIDNLTVFSYSQWTCPRDLTQIGNVCNVHGANFNQTLVESHSVSSGNSVTLNQVKPTQVTSVTVNGTEQSKGVYGNANDTFTNYQVLVDFPNHKLLWQANFTATVVVTYNADVAIRAQEIELASIQRYQSVFPGGKAYIKINDTTLTTTAAAKARAFQELAQRAYELCTPKFYTFLPLSAGQTVLITNSTEVNPDGSAMTKSPYLVNKVTPHLRGQDETGHDVIEYECECGADIPSFVRVNKRLHKSTARSKALAGAALTSQGFVLRDSFNASGITDSISFHLIS